MIAILILAATITSPHPGDFIARPAWVGNSAVTAAHTPGNANFDTSFRRIDGPLAESVLATEEAYWERYYCNAARGDDFSRIPPSLAAFFAWGTWYDEVQAFPSQYGASQVSLPSDREMSSRRIYRPALGWMLDNLFSSAGSGWGRLISSMANTNAMAVADRVSRSGPYYTSSIVTDSRACPTTAWVEYDDVIDALSGWVGIWNWGYIDTAIRYPGSTSYRLPIFYNDIVSFCNCGRDAEPFWTSAQFNEFEAAHLLPLPNAPSNILNSTFGSVIDYDAAFADKSRRITWERIAAYNRIAAALDRSTGSCWPDTPATKDATEGHWHSRLTIDASIPASSLVVQSGEIVVSPGTTVSYGTPTWSDTTTNVTVEAAGSAFYSFAELGPVGSSVTAQVSPRQIMAIEMTAQDFAGLPYSAASIASGSASVAVTPSIVTHAGSPMLAISFVGDGLSSTKYRPIDLPSSGDLSFMLVGNASYTMTTYRPTQQLTLTNGWPAVGAWTTGRIRQVEVGYARHLVDGVSLSDITYWSRPKYTKFSDTVAISRGAIGSFFSNEFGDDLDMATSVALDGAGFSSGINLHELLTDNANSVKSDIAFSPSLSVYVPQQLTATVTFEQGTSQIESVVFSDGTGIAGAVMLNIGPSGAATTSRLGHAAKIFWQWSGGVADWNFNTLRLNR